MKLETLVYDFLTEVKLRHANGTWRFYKNHLEHFLKFAQAHGSVYVSEVNNELLVEYVSHMKKTCENVTINKNIGCVKRMFKRMNIEHVYLQQIDKLKERQKTFDTLDRETFKKVRQHIRNYPTVTVNGTFYKCFLALLSDTGARINEIMMIEKRNVCLERREILLTHTKTNDDRIVYLSEKVGLPAVQKMLSIKHTHKFLLHNIERNRPANYDDIRYILKLTKKQLNIPKLHPHMFRHTTATTLIEAGADIASIMSILGHKNIQTTERYLHVSKKHVKKTYQDKINKFDD